MAKRTSTETLGIWLVVAAVAFAGFLVWAIESESAIAFILFGISVVVILALITGMFSRRHQVGAAGKPLPAAKPDDGIYRVLVVVDDGATSPAFRDELVKSAGGRPAKAFVVAPALSSKLDRWTGDQAAYDQAAEELDATLHALDALGIESSGHIGSHDPLQAAVEGLREFPADAVVVATHEGSKANWAEDGLVDSIRKITTVPVSHVVVDGDGA